MENQNCFNALWSLPCLCQEQGRFEDLYKSWPARSPASILGVYCILLRILLMLVMKLINTVWLVLECLAQLYSWIITLDKDTICQNRKKRHLMDMSLLHCSVFSGLHYWTVPDFIEKNLHQDGWFEITKIFRKVWKAKT